MRLLLILIVIALVFYIVRSAIRKPAGRDSKPGRGESMVSCAQCNLHIPRSEAIAIDEQYFCSDAHLQQWQQDRGTGSSE